MQPTTQEALPTLQWMECFLFLFHPFLFHSRRWNVLCKSVGIRQPHNHAAQGPAPPTHQHAHSMLTWMSKGKVHVSASGVPLEYIEYIAQTYQRGSKILDPMSHLHHRTTPPISRNVTDLPNTEMSPENWAQ